MAKGPLGLMDWGEIFQGGLFNTVIASTPSIIGGRVASTFQSIIFRVVYENMSSQPLFAEARQKAGWR